MNDLIQEHFMFQCISKFEFLVGNVIMINKFLLNEVLIFVQLIKVKKKTFFMSLYSQTLKPNRNLNHLLFKH